MLLETVFLDERRIELQSGFLGGVLPSEECDKGLALIALELDHLFAIVFDDVAVASCFGIESVFLSQEETRVTMAERGGGTRGGEY